MHRTRQANSYNKDMRPPMEIIKELARSFEHYLTIEAVDPIATYSYVTRGFFDLPIVNTVCHRPKCKAGETWTYVAIPRGSTLTRLGSTDRLYVGAQTVDRMFRGDDKQAKNFHHAQMRKGNGDDNLVNFLRTGKSIEIHRIPGDGLLARLERDADLEPLRWILHAPKTKKQHTGFWLEQAILHLEPNQWRWNTARAVDAVQTQIDKAVVLPRLPVGGL